MTRSIANFIGVVASLAFAIGMPGDAHAQATKAGSLVIESPWVRATPGGAKVGGGYLAIKNNGAVPDRLVGGSFPIAGHVEIHEMKMEGDVMRMRSLSDGLEIRPGETVQLKPGGYHMMFMDLKEPFKPGETVKGELRFEKAGAVPVEFRIEAVGAAGPMPGKHGH